MKKHKKRKHNKNLNIPRSSPSLCDFPPHLSRYRFIWFFLTMRVGEIFWIENLKWLCIYKVKKVENPFFKRTPTIIWGGDGGLQIVLEKMGWNVRKVYRSKKIPLDVCVSRVYTWAIHLVGGAHSPNSWHRVWCSRGAQWTHEELVWVFLVFCLAKK